MSRLVDPTLCPDCRGHLDAGATCTSCGLAVTGPLAVQLWTRMVAADEVVEQLRALSPARPTPAAASAPAAPTPPAAALPVFPHRAGPAFRPRRRLPAASVPVVLLSLGGLCLLVAAVVFVAVAWGALGLTGRTLVLLGVTALLATAGTAVTRRGLRGAAETLWIVVAGMLTVDLLGARTSGLLGLDVLGWRGTGALVGTALLGLGLGVAAWARTQPVRTLYGAQLVALGGATLLTGTNAWLAERADVGTAISVPVLSGLALLVLPTLRPAAVGFAALAVTSWAVLVGIGWGRGLSHAGGAWWSDVEGWPLLAAATFAAAAVPVRTIDDRIRSVAAAMALAPLAMLAIAPANTDNATLAVLLACAALGALAALTRFAPRVWARGAASLAGAGALTFGLLLLAYAGGAVAGIGAEVGARDVLIDTRLGVPDQTAQPWTAVLVAIAAVAGLASLVRVVGARAGSVVIAVAPATLALGVLVTVIGYEAPLWAGVLSAVLATGVAGAATWTVRADPAAAAIGGMATATFAAGALVAAIEVPLLAALTASVLAVGLAATFAIREAEGGSAGPAVLAGSATLVGAVAVDGWVRAMGTEDLARALALAVFAAVVAVLASAATRTSRSRLSFEAASVLVAVAGAALAPTLVDVAMVLTVVGSGASLVAVLNRDRLHAGWAAALVLGVATAIRVEEAVSFPEAYTLPAAVLLVAAGAWRMRTDTGASSFAVLGSGLTLGLLPSLLLALDEPVSLRGALLGAAVVLVLAAGLRLRLAAPFVLGAMTTGLLAVRHLEPYADAVPRWISLGTVGLALLVVGVTWEARRRNLETAGRYLAALR